MGGGGWLGGGDGGTRASHVIHEGTRGSPDVTSTTWLRRAASTTVHISGECEMSSAPYTAAGAATVALAPKCSWTLAPGRWRSN